MAIGPRLIDGNSLMPPFNRFGISQAVIGIVLLMLVGILTFTPPISSEWNAYIFLITLGCGLAADLFRWKGSSLGKPANQLMPGLLLLCATIPILITLHETWRLQIASDYTIGGLLPASDASWHANGARALLANGELSQAGSRRPLSTGWFAALFSLGPQNPQLFLTCQAVIMGLVCFMTGKELLRWGSASSAAWVVVAGSDAMGHQAGLCMTEAPALVCSALGLLLFLQALRCRSWWAAGFSLFVLGLGQEMRPGSILLIPSLLVYYAVLLGHSRKSRLIGLARLAIPCVAVALASAIVFLAAAPPGGLRNSNLYHTLYGIASGGEKWDYIFTAEPEVLEITDEEERAARIKELFWEKIEQSPKPFFDTLLERYPDCFFNMPKIYTTLNGEFITWIMVFAFWPALLLTGWYLTRRYHAWIIVPLVFLCTLATVPLLFDAYLRVHAATYFLQLGHLFPLLFLLNGGKFISQLPKPDPTPKSGFIVAGLVAAVSLLPIPLALHTSEAARQQIPMPGQPTQHMEGVTYYDPSFTVTVKDHKHGPQEIITFWNPYHVDWLNYFLILPSADTPQAAGYYRFEAELNSNFQKRRIYQVKAWDFTEAADSPFEMPPP